MSNELIRQTVLSGTDIHNDFRKTAKPEPAHIFTYFDIIVAEYQRRNGG